MIQDTENKVITKSHTFMEFGGYWKGEHEENKAE